MIIPPVRRREMRRSQTQVFMALGFLGLLFSMPLSGNGADFTISNVITGSGNMRFNGAISGASFGGSGSGLTNLDPLKFSSGTANINISGTAATVTNGVYSSGSYAPDPFWTTPLSPNELTSGTANINIRAMHPWLLPLIPPILLQQMGR